MAGEWEIPPLKKGVPEGRGILLFASSFRLDGSFAELDELRHIGAALQEGQATHLYLVVGLDAGAGTEGPHARNNTRTLDFAGKTADDAHGVLTGILADFDVYHGEKITYYLE